MKRCLWAIFRGIVAATPIIVLYTLAAETGYASRWMLFLTLLWFWLCMDDIFWPKKSSRRYNADKETTQ